MSQKRRRIDLIQDPSFTADIAHIATDELRNRKAMCDDVEHELSYYRRLLHGRLDLLTHERRRRKGETSVSLTDAIPEILGDTSVAASTADEGVTTPMPASASTSSPPPNTHLGRRPIDAVLGDGFLARLIDMSDNELDETENRLRSTEETVSRHRMVVHEAEAVIGGELAIRYRDLLDDEGGLDIDDLLAT